MYSFLLSGLTSLGGQLLSNTVFAPKTNSSTALNFSNLLSAKENTTTSSDSLGQLSDAIKNHPALKGLYSGNSNSKLTLETTSEGNCLIKENDKALLVCSPNSELGQLCVSFKTLCVLNNKNLEIGGSNIAFRVS